MSLGTLNQKNIWEIIFLYLKKNGKLKKTKKNKIKIESEQNLISMLIGSSAELRKMGSTIAELNERRIRSLSSYIPSLEHFYMRP